MKHVRRIFDNLIGKLTLSNETDASSAAVLHMLENIASALDEGDLHAARAACGQLDAYWLRSVAWCSELSKEIEKCLIAFEEYLSGQ